CAVARAFRRPAGADVRWCDTGPDERRERPMLIGRAAELAELTGALERAAGGSAALALVGGDAGVGKTHLVSALVRTARDKGCTVLLGQCAELGESMPYLPRVHRRSEGNPFYAAELYSAEIRGGGL